MQHTMTLTSIELSQLLDNDTEQIMRDLATGRKNFMFSGSDEAAKKSSLFVFAYAKL